MSKFAFLVPFGVFAAVACAPTPLNPAAMRVLVTKQPAPQGCVYIGSVIGEQGGSLTGGMTSNASLAEGAMNDMKNKAFALGANYVVLEDTAHGGTMDKGSSGQTDVTHTGNAYKCPENGTPGTAPAAPAAARAPGT
jgi:uncharacterized protein YbjQ (UPF0145 family)